MEYKIVLVAMALFVLSQGAEALKCYMCNSQLPNRTCFTPIDVTQVPAFECNKTSANLARLFSSSVDPRILQAADNGTQYECVMFQKQYFNSNITEMTRDCFPKHPEVDTCLALNISTGISANFTKCETCTTDLCNSSSALQMSGLLFLCVCLWTTVFYKLI